MSHKPQKSRLMLLTERYDEALATLIWFHAEMRSYAKRGEAPSPAKMLTWIGIMEGVLNTCGRRTVPDEPPADPAE